jgi:hypothetical protein
MKASGGVLCPLEAFCVLYQDSCPTFIKHRIKIGREKDENKKIVLW